MAASAKYDAHIDLELVDESDRVFEGWITVDIVDRQKDRLDPEGFTAKEYMAIIGGTIQGTHSNIPIGRWEWIELRDKPKTKEKAWYGRGKIHKGTGDLEDYPVWQHYWEYMVSRHRQGKPVGLSIGGDPDYQNKPPQIVCDSGGCHRRVPKTYWYETSVVMSDRGPANPEAVIASINTMAKALGEPRFSELMKAAHVHPHVNFRGLKIYIENPKGSVRRGKNKDGKEWANVLAADYGYIKRTEGADGDDVDVFVGPHQDADRVFVIYQIDQESGKFDEHKCFLGFHTREEAEKAYLNSYDAGWKVGPVVEMEFEHFSRWMKFEGLKKRAPSVTESPNEQGTTGRLAGDVGHIHPPSGMDREDPVDDDRRYPEQKLIPEVNVRRLGEAFPSLRRRGVAGRGIRGVKHSTGADRKVTRPPAPKASMLRSFWLERWHAMNELQKATFPGDGELFTSLMVKHVLEPGELDDETSEVLERLCGECDEHYAALRETETADEEGDLEKRYSVEEKEDQYATMAVKAQIATFSQLRDLGKTPDDPELEKLPADRSVDNNEKTRAPGKPFGALTLAADAKPSPKLPQDFRDGGVPALAGAGVYKAQGEPDGTRHGDFSPTDKEIAEGTGLMLHGGRRYPHEAKRVQTAGMIGKMSPGFGAADGGVTVADGGDLDNQQGMVGSMGNLRVSQTAARRT